jgi:hypothetical protein
VEITAARRFGIAEKVLQFLGLLADLGYIGLHPDAVTGYKRKRGENTLSPGKKAANLALASLRAIGEPANAQPGPVRVSHNRCHSVTRTRLLDNPITRKRSSILASG